MLAENLICVLLYLSSALAENAVLRGKLSEDYIPCETGWFFFDNKCYKLGGKKRSARLDWDKAAAHCVEEGGTLATVNSKEVNGFLVTFLLLDAKDSVWIGLNDQVNESTYTWQDGATFDYENWDLGEPSGSNAEHEDCAEMVFIYAEAVGLHKTGRWNDIGCTVNKAYICQTDTSKRFKRTADPRFCPGSEGAWKYQDSCYNVVTEKLSWQDAEQHCQDKFQGHLVTIADYTVDMFLDYILTNLNKEMWIGIKIEDKLQQKWSSGWHVAYSDLPDPQGDFVDDKCVLRSKQKLWTATSCSKVYSFVCERSNVVPPVLKQSAKGSRCPALPDDWRDLGGDYCYFFETITYVNWYRANFECMRRGGSLVSIHSSAENVTLHSFVKYTQEKIYIGLHRLEAHDDVFVWADGSYLGFKNWDADEPNNENERCGELRTRTMKWNDAKCKDQNGYICSVKKVSPNITVIKEQVDCSAGISMEALVGVSACILLVVILLVVVIYCLRPCGGREEKRTWRKSNLQPPIPTTERPRYRTAEIVVKDDDYQYEDMH